MDEHNRNLEEWRDAKNWRWGIYRAPLDTRVWVPKRPKWAGWTLNFAHPAAYAWLAALLLPGLAVTVLAFAVSG